MDLDVVIIGGGAAGLFCAIHAGKRGLKTLVIEHNAEVGRKIIISGGGRCNFTNIHTTPENFVSANPHFARSALARFQPSDFIDIVKRHRIAFHEKKLGQLFCIGRSRDIVDMLLAECSRSRVRIETRCSVTAVERAADGFAVRSGKGDLKCRSLVIATGGLSFPKIGATGLGYRLARQFGIAVEPVRPSLVPLVFDREHQFAKLAGISLDAEVAAGAAVFRENILFTHRGLSGPAILQASNYWHPGETLVIDILPGTSFSEIIVRNRDSKQRVDNFLKRHLPERFVDTFGAGRFPLKPLNELSKKDISALSETIHGWRPLFRDTEGWHKAEVTIGGVSTSELSSQTMEAKKVPGLYFIGEVVDVTGWLGGYNFQWAWASGFAAGQAV
jgi:predicted Rossmann fold flavoprotein